MISLTSNPTLEAVWAPAADLEIWETFQVGFRDFIRKVGGAGENHRHVVYISHLLNFCAEKCEGVLDIGVLRQYFEHLQDDSYCYYCSPERVAAESKKRQTRYSLQHKLAGGTLKKQKSSIMRFLYYYERDLADDFQLASWARKLRPPRQEQFKPRLQEADFERFIKTHVVDNLRLDDGTFVPARRFALWLQFQFALGVRELIHLQVADLDLENHFIHVTRHKTQARFSVPIYNETKQLPRLQKWLLLREKTLTEWNEAFPELLFRYRFLGTSKDYVAPWTEDAYSQKLVKLRLFKGTQFDQKGTASHEIRRWGASHLHYDKKWSIRDVQRLLGHTDPATTARYIQSDVVEWKERVSS